MFGVGALCHAVSARKRRLLKMKSDSGRHRGGSLSGFFSLASTSAEPLSGGSVLGPGEVGVKFVQEFCETILVVLFRATLGSSHWGSSKLGCAKVHCVIRPKRQRGTHHVR